MVSFVSSPLQRATNAVAPTRRRTIGTQPDIQNLKSAISVPIDLPDGQESGELGIEGGRLFQTRQVSGLRITASSEPAMPRCRSRLMAGGSACLPRDNDQGRMMDSRSVVAIRPGHERRDRAGDRRRRLARSERAQARRGQGFRGGLSRRGVSGAFIGHCGRPFSLRRRSSASSLHCLRRVRLRPVSASTRP